MENGMFVDLRGQGGRRDRILFACQATVPMLMILMTTVSCSRPADMPVGIVDLFSGREAPNLQPVQRDETPPKVRRPQPKTSPSPKVATVHPPKAAQPPNAPHRSVSPPAAKKASTPQRANDQREQRLFQEFLEWRKRQKDLP